LTHAVCICWRPGEDEERQENDLDPRPRCTSAGSIKSAHSVASATWMSPLTNPFVRARPNRHWSPTIPLVRGTVHFGETPHSLTTGQYNAVHSLWTWSRHVSPITPPSLATDLHRSSVSVRAAIHKFYGDHPYNAPRLPKSVQNIPSCRRIGMLNGPPGGCPPMMLTVR